ncbi:MAG: hypothetical protein JXX29_04970 [Deltaproteobacteria bacterium]|nr:hypothetical protein [Deltaproteobacteria bacterium]MBN2670998.1 hypothetical protein [Deltaproteobacteria bacterium]
MNVKSAMIVGLAVAGLSGCNAKKNDIEDLGRANAPAQSTQTPAPTGQMPSGMVETASTGKVHSGTILETIDVSNYTYIRFKDNQNLEHWAAVLKGKFEKGQPVSIVESIVQKNFNSPSLNRTFETIIFGNVKGAGAPTADMAPQGALPAGHPPIDGSKAAPEAALPEGHPPVEGNAPKTSLPEGHPPISNIADTAE